MWSKSKSKVALVWFEHLVHKLFLESIKKQMYGCLLKYLVCCLMGDCKEHGYSKTA